jgi:hypothetical protein
MSIDEAIPSLTLRSPMGELWLAWVNAYGSGDALDIDIDPVVVTIGGSGCSTTLWTEACDANGAIALQRGILDFGNGIVPVSLFDGLSGVVPAGSFDMTIIVETAERIVCWDDDCAGDDSGPFDRFTFPGVAIPPV